jgi:hypothetical protein
LNEVVPVVHVSDQHKRGSSRCILDQRELDMLNSTLGGTKSKEYINVLLCRAPGMSLALHVLALRSSTCCSRDLPNQQRMLRRGAMHTHHVSLGPLASVGVQRQVGCVGG